MIPQIVVAISLTLELIGSLNRNSCSNRHERIGFTIGAFIWTSTVVTALHFGGFW